ncbi:MAG: ral secretion pathway protein, partial [Abditibacteriota bacterium]|nr:ral secretion pathway protein [Abditibacteriota bacterium]
DGGGGGGLFDLSEQGIDQIIAVDPQNALLVYGTEQGVRALETIIQYLDRPLRQVEIESQFVNVSTTDARSFGIDFQSSNGPFTVSTSGLAPAAGNGALTLGFVRGNFQATLNSLIRQDRAKIVNSPRVTAINNLTASLQSMTQTPVILTTAQQGGGIGGGVAQGQNLIFINTSIGITVTPTINNDDTITVVMQPNVSTQRPTSLGVPQVFQQTVQTVANVKDGDTIALGGLRTKAISRGGARIPILSDIPFLGKLFRSSNVSEEDGELIIFLTARIIRRLDETEAVPGT